MNRFIKFSKLIINTKNIQRVDIKPNQYTITYTNSDIFGMVLAGYGYIESSNKKIILSNESEQSDENKLDYEIFDKWIKSIDKDEHI